MIDLSGRVALVTGGSRGIGRAICLKFAALGAKVAVNYNANQAAAQEVVEGGGGLAAVFKAECIHAEQCPPERCDALVAIVRA